MLKKLDQFSYMLCSLIECTQHNTSEGIFHEPRVIGYDDRNNILRRIRLDFSHFDCNNLAGWVFKATQFFNFRQTPLNQKFVMASFHMEGEALVRYQDTLDSRHFLGWDKFFKALQVCFGPLAYDDHMEALTRLK